MDQFKHLIENIRSNKPLLVAVILTGTIIIGVLVLAISKSPLFDRDREYNDPLSGETVYNPADRTPESYNQVDQVTYLGFTGLVDRGLSFDTSQEFKNRLSKITIGDEKITEVSIDVESIKHGIEKDKDNYQFDIRFNRKHNFTTNMDVLKSDNSFTFDFSGSGIENIKFN